MDQNQAVAMIALTSLGLAVSVTTLLGATYVAYKANKKLEAATAKAKAAADEFARFRQGMSNIF